MMQAHVFISGTVQGVGFRYFVRSNARKLGLTGFVRNTEDGGVESLFQGDKEAIEKMVSFCRNGPFLAEVKQIGVEWKEVKESFTDFIVL